MAIQNIFAISEVKAGSPQHEGRKHLQRLIRKVKHVLVVKHYIDDLKGGVGLRHCRGVLQKSYVHSAPIPIGGSSGCVATLISARICPVQSTFGRDTLQGVHSNGCPAKQLKAY
jgi:hypothetical protein